MMVNTFRGIDAAAVLCQDNLTVQNNLHVGGNFTCNGSMPSPYWAGGCFDTNGVVQNQKGIHNMTITRIGTDSAYDVVFPAHPDGARFTCLHASTEYHSSIRSQTSVGFRIYTRKSNNTGGPTEGTGEVSVVILR